MDGLGPADLVMVRSLVCVLDRRQLVPAGNRDSPLVSRKLCRLSAESESDPSVSALINLERPQGDKPPRVIGTAAENSEVAARIRLVAVAVITQPDPTTNGIE